MKKRYIIGIVAIVLVFGFIIYSFSKSMAMIENDSRVAPNSKLTYYIDVIYDGKDSEVVTSSDTATAKVNSDYIYVEDKIPDGLTFNKFITAEDGTVGAVKRSDGSSCPGYVVGDSDGLVYDNSTNTVSFKVKNLQAGCKLTVGIETTTPSLDGAKRRDFYNTADARENYFSVRSNTIHVFMGEEEDTMYTVNYQYTGDVPDGVPNVPNSSQYLDGVSVGVENDVSIGGYTFSGWTTEDVEVTNGKFTMPSSNVTFTGHFIAKSTYDVSYSIDGVKPDGYMPPTIKNYGVGDDVVIDTMQEGDIVNGYRFLGWTSTGIDLDDGIFVMPNKNVELVGKFEKVVYALTYQFQGTEIPDNADSLLPETKSYAPGEKITLASNPETIGYEFLGWYHEDNFEMPDSDLTIYGEWKVKNGVFSPSISKEIVDKKDYYHEGDEVNFKITVSNNASYRIREVLIQEDLDGVSFIDGTGYTVKSNKYAVIDEIAANGSIILNAKYVVGNDALKTITNTVKITGALADNNNELDISREYKSSTNFVVSNIKLTINKKNNSNEDLSGAEYKLYSDKEATNEVGSGLKYSLLPNKTYYLKESRAPAGYKIAQTTYKVNVSDTGIVTVDGQTVSGSDGNYIVTLFDEEINILPNTGGSGVYIYIIVGLLLMVIGALGYYIYKNRKGKR